MSDPTCTVPDCTKPLRARGLCSTHYNRQAGRGYRTETVACALDGCGLTVIKRADPRRPKRYCSDLCRDLAVTPEWACPVPARHQARRPWPEVGPAHRVFIPDCSICGRRFATPYTVTTCSPVCAEAKRVDDKKRDRDKRRSLERDAFVAPVYRARIYARDKWTCHLCGKKVSRTAPVPHPRAATLDHLVPLAAGGKHEPANVATACFLCNARKGDRGHGEQLALL